MKEVKIKWELAYSLEDLHWHRCLYAYILRKRIVYIGKADKMTVEKRFYGEHKDRPFVKLGCSYR